MAVPWPIIMRRAFRPTAGSFALAPAPAPNDLVIHFRDLRDCGGWQQARATSNPSDPAASARARSAYRPANAASRWFYDLDLYAPPLAFYEAAIEAHVVRWSSARVWIACLPCDRSHPTVAALVAKSPRSWGRDVHFLTNHAGASICNRVPSCKVPPILDFLWMQKARHLVLSPSTFGWWSAYLSERAVAIHYPVLPMFSPWGPTMWCHMLPEDDSRYVFHDPWARMQWRGGTRSSHGARRRCDVYMRACLQSHSCALSESSAAAARRALPLDGIEDFVTYVEDGHELEGLTTAELEGAARRHNLSLVELVPVGSDHGRRSHLLDAISGSAVAEAMRKEARTYLSAMNRAPPPRRAS